ncbi:MAG: OmpH family outer membrane protein [Alphaproteobacteria bacterium]|nr:OmpH family outer membrane protein [Alphaproteobacteria bacterium]
MKKLTKNISKIKPICANKKVRLAGCLLAGIIVLSWAWCVTTRPGVGVIDFAVAQGKAKVYQSVIQEQKKYEEQIRVRIVADSGDIEKEAAELEKKKASMKPEEYQKKMMSLQNRMMVIQEKYRPAIERIMAASQIALKGAEKEIAKAVEQTARQKGVKVLLPVTSVLYADKKADMTDAFVKNLDKLVQTVSYPDPAKLGG